MDERNIHRLFEAGVTLKGLHALLELAVGAAILAVGPVTVSDFFYALAQREWIGGGRVSVANFLLRLAQQSLQGGQHFAGTYLIVLGMINMVLAIGLLASALWSYPASLAAIALLAAYQVYRYTHTHALILILLTVYDAVVWWLVRHEYLVLRSRVAMERQSSKASVVESGAM